MTKAFILEFLKTHKEELARRYGVEKIGLFGSYAKDVQHEDSDIDIAILSNKKDFFLREELRERLQEAFGAPVDLGYLDSFRSFYKDRVEREIVYA